MGSTVRRRLDVWLVRRALAQSRNQAAQLIANGQVLVDGAVADKPARMVGADQAVVLIGPPPKFVSRAGEKLEYALDQFGIDPAGLRCLDAGSSTGGFTDCLLQRGARQVWAVDVGTHQLHERIRADPRVEVREQTDIRRLELADVGARFDLVVTDLSFISLRLVMAHLVALAGPNEPILALVKPQFEAGRREASKGKGVIKDPLVWARVLGEVAETARYGGRYLAGARVSPITGAKGNVEFVTCWRAMTPNLDSVLAVQLASELIDQVVAEAEAGVL